MLFFDMFRHDPEFIEIRKGELLFREGEPGEVMYILIEGEAEITIRGVLLDVCEQGTFMGEMALLDGSPRYTTVTARTDCKFVIVDRKRFQFLVDEAPSFAIDIMRLMAKRLRHCDQQVLELTMRELHPPEAGIQ